MDLREHKVIARRHPWEIVRLKVLEYILNKCIINKQVVHKVLDVGCGDAYIIKALYRMFNFKIIDGVDINLSSEQLVSFKPKDTSVHLYNNYDNLELYELILLNDIIEHVEDDRAFLSNIAAHYLAPGGYIIITVPAFQFLFSSHDDFLSHFRRYNLKELEELINQLGMKRIESGYLFFSLLPIRFLMKILEIVFPAKSTPNKGIGDWRGGKIISSIIENILLIDSYILLTLSFLHIRIPGLSAWILCQKQL